MNVSVDILNAGRNAEYQNIVALQRYFSKLPLPLYMRFPK